MAIESPKPTNARVNLWSCDIIGPRRSVYDFITMHEGLMTPQVPIHGVEIFAIRPLQQLHVFIEAMRNNGYDVVSIHGRTGGQGSSLLDSASLSAMNASMIPTPSLIEQFNSSFQILVHAPEAIQNIDSLRNAPGKIWIENHINKDGMKEAIAVVEDLRVHGRNASVILDVAHLIGPKNLISEDFCKIHDQTLKQLDKYLAMKDDCHMPYVEAWHLPLGRKKNDSVPIESMSDQQLTAYAALLDTYCIKQLVIEHQEEGLQKIIYLTRQQMDSLWRRHNMIVNRLVKTNILRST